MLASFLRRAGSGAPNGAAASGLPILDGMSNYLKANAAEQRIVTTGEMEQNGHAAHANAKPLFALALAPSRRHRAPTTLELTCRYEGNSRPYYRALR